MHLIRELDKYFSLRKTPKEIRLPFVFRSISDTFTKQWMLTAYRQLRSYDDFKGHLRSYFGTVNINLRSGVGRTKIAKVTSREKVSRSITSDMPT